MNEIKPKLNLDRPAAYEIIVPGHLQENWSEWNNQINIVASSGADGLPVSIINCTFDQASLLSLLRRLYSFGLPLISVRYVDNS